MPIYGYNTLGAPPYSMEDILERTVKRDMDKILYKAKNEFAYRQDIVFCDTIKIDYKSRKFIASFDSSKTLMPEVLYMNRLEELIKEANFILNKEKKYKDLKFDIMGSWTIGYIIIMRKNKDF